MSTELTTAQSTSVVPGFGSVDSWKLANRIAEAFAASTIVPQAYVGNVANCIVALEMANRMGASPLLVMQNLYIVHGNPSWSSKFLVACFNQCGRFTALRYEWDRDEAGKPVGCRAWATEKATGERLVGSTVTIAMAAAEGWSTKSGSKWKTMPELMLQYRAAAFFIRVYAPEISMGMQTDDEVIDVGPGEIVSGKPEVTMPQERLTDVLDQSLAQADQREHRGPVPATTIDGETGEVIAADASNTVTKQEAGQEQSEQQAAAPAAAPAAAKPAAKAQTIGNTALASAGEKKLLLNRAKSNDLNMAELIEQAGIGPMDPATLDGLTADGFTAIKDLLPRAA